MKKVIFNFAVIISLIFVSCTTPTNRGTESYEEEMTQGGIIVYEKDGHGLVAAPNDLERMTWDDAMSACNNLELNGYSDWHLPTKKELNTLYQNKDRVGGFADNYWSSTEGNNDNAWEQNVNNGVQYYNYKDNKCHVRAVRAF